jgi:hypothetical protein
MSKIKILSGDFPKQNGQLISGNMFRFINPGHSILGEKISTSNLTALDEVSHEEAKRILGTAGMGILGMILFGWIGLIVGLICGGNSRKVIFRAEFRDGRKFIAQCNKKVFNNLKADVFYTIQHSAKKVCLEPWEV